MGHDIITQSTQFLTFKLANETFAVEISRIKEVLEYTSLTKVPRTPGFMCGVINLRGSVVPVIDLRRKFDMSPGEKTVNTCIIIIETHQEDRVTVLGGLVDSVQEVMTLDPEQVEPAPRIGTKLKTGFIRGMGKHGDRFIIILNTDSVFSSEELSQINAETGSSKIEQAA